MKGLGFEFQGVFDGSDLIDGRRGGRERKGLGYPVFLGLKNLSIALSGGLRGVGPKESGHH